MRPEVFVETFCNVSLEITCQLHSCNRMMFHRQQKVSYICVNLLIYFCILFVFFLSGLQMTDVELDERVTVLEENGGGGGSGQNGHLSEISHFNT